MDLKFIIDRKIMIRDYLYSVGISRTLERKIRLYGVVLVNNKERKNNEFLDAGDVLEVQLPVIINEKISKTKGKLDILFEDQWILIVNKEANLSVQPSKKHLDNNLISYVLNYFSSKNELANAHILTRLDYATSGIVVIAKNPYVHNLLANSKIVKKYRGLTSSLLPENIGNIHLPIMRDETSNIKRIVAVDGKDSHTEYKYISSCELGYLYEFILHTGRTHQIRVHLEHLGSPLVGDQLYSGKEYSRLCLHCSEINFIHPLTKQEVKITNFSLF